MPAALSRRLRGLGLLLAAAVCLGACSMPSRDADPAPSHPEPTLTKGTDPPATPSPTRTPRPSPGPEGPPNIVLMLLDDATMQLVRTMPSALRMEREGASYEQSYVVDSLCCVSRASLFTGQYPHQTGVLINSVNDTAAPLGGWQAFETYGNEMRSFNVNLEAAGYRTGFIGKYLNEYEPARGPLPTPPGWTRFQPVFGGAYAGWNFTTGLAVDGGPLEYTTVPGPPETATRRERDQAYAGTVIHQQAVRFVRKAEQAPAPYFLEVAVYAPHQVVTPPFYPGDPAFPPALRDRPRGGDGGNCGAVACDDIDVDEYAPGFGADRDPFQATYSDGSPAPDWHELKPMEAERATRNLRDQARMLQSADRTLSRILDLVGDNTYVVLTSDNGMHLGQYGLYRGKGTPYLADVQVPLLVTGPGVEPGPRAEMVTNLDLAPTFEHLAGLKPPAYRSGRSIVPSLRRPDLAEVDYSFVEHTWAGRSATDPDLVDPQLGEIPSYVAVRSRHDLLVRVDLADDAEAPDHAWEYYDYRPTGREVRNSYGEDRYADRIAKLTQRLEAFDACARDVTQDDPVTRTCRRLSLDGRPR